MMLLAAALRPLDELSSIGTTKTRPYTTLIGLFAKHSCSGLIAVLYSSIVLLHCGVGWSESARVMRRRGDERPKLN
jgi:hypothetical protein